MAAKAAHLADKTQGTLIAFERNALVYAGFTVWNQRKKHRPTREDPRRTMLWRPRAEWVISEKVTHDALITRKEADKILALVDKDNPRSRGLDIRKPDYYLLTGLLFTPDGAPWQADGRFYRLGRKGQRVLREAVDELVLHQIAREIRGEAFVAQVVQGAHEMAAEIEDNPATLDQALRSVEAKINA